MARVRWSPVPAGDGRCFVYSPRFGTTYLVEPEVLESAAFRLLVGLHRDGQCEKLPDPALSVDRVGAFEKPLSTLCRGDATDGSEASARLRRLYLVFHRHRFLASIPRVVGAARWIGRARREPRRGEVSEVGRTVMAVEGAVGVSDCYPRALLTAYLCATAGLRYEIAVGILAPTSNLHAWCAVEGVVPFEPVLHHWWYQPLVVVDAG